MQIVSDLDRAAEGMKQFAEARRALEQGDAQNALVLCDSALRILEPIATVGPAISQLLVARGNALLGLGRPGETLQAAGAAMHALLATPSRGPDAIASVLNLAGVAHRQLGQLSAALGAQREA